jgi:hypothetical protein
LGDGDGAILSRKTGCMTDYYESGLGPPDASDIRTILNLLDNVMDVNKAANDNQMTQRLAA